MRVKITALLFTLFASLSAWGQMISQTVDSNSRIMAPNAGQSFTATATTQIGRISVRPGNVFNGNLLIYNGNVGSGTIGAAGAPVYSQAGVSLAASTTNGPMRDIVLTTPFPVTNGSTYTFILEGVSGFFLGNPDPYAGGQLLHSYADTSLSAYDFAFQIWPVAAASPASIPTLSQWGLWLLSMLLGVFAVAQVRRNRGH